MFGIDLAWVYVANCLGIVAAMVMAYDGFAPDAPCHRVIFVAAIYILFSPITFVVTGVCCGVIFIALICESIRKMFSSVM